MTINVPLLRKILEHITAHPAEWNQQNWGLQTDCGTAFCVAGHAVAMTGHTLVWRGQMLVGVDDGRTAADIRRTAREELGLTGEQAGVLFESDNTLRELWEYASDFTDGEIQVPAEVAAS
jgi:hypothetical protein